MDMITKDQAQTKALGRAIGALLLPGDVVALTGELGAGKTTLIQGLAEGIGVADFVSSPSFIIINEYAGKAPFYHMDLYRMNDECEIEDLGIEEYFGGKGIVAVEWAERLGALLPAKHISIALEMLAEDERKISIDEKGTRRLEGKL